MQNIVHTPRAPKPTLAELMDINTVRGDECWEWIGRKSEGYGRVSRNGRYTYAHRAAYALTHGEITPGMVIDHMCRNRGCVNPDHLQAVTRQENNENRSNDGYGGTKVRGVSFDKNRGKYAAYAIHHNRKYNAGRHGTLAEAEKAARDLRLRLHVNNLADRGNGASDERAA